MFGQGSLERPSGVTLYRFTNWGLCRQAPGQSQKSERADLWPQASPGAGAPITRERGPLTSGGQIPLLPPLQAAGDSWLSGTLSAQIRFNADYSKNKQLLYPWFCPRLPSWWIKRFTADETFGGDGSQQWPNLYHWALSWNVKKGRTTKNLSLIQETMGSHCLFNHIYLCLYILYIYQHMVKYVKGTSFENIFF